VTVTDEPRRHHYMFAHRELPSGARRFGADLVAAGRDGQLTLDVVWNRVGEGLPEPDRLPAEGLSHSYHERAGHRVLLISLPTARYPTEAHFTAIAVPTEGEAVRYFTLEYAVSPMDGGRYTVLGEWNEQRHINYGEGPPPDADAFLTAIDQMLSRRS
jgi:hypothetical protein